MVNKLNHYAMLNTASPTKKEDLTLNFNNYINNNNKKSTSVNVILGGKLFYFQTGLPQLGESL
jgi:uncharacterized Fe-S cluster-containing radical SAM superfamily enzyme